MTSSIRIRESVFCHPAKLALDPTEVHGPIVVPNSFNKLQQWNFEPVPLAVEMRLILLS
jgi:hypothetical protein